MPSPLFRNEAISQVRTVLVRARDSGLLEHPGLTGRAREVFVKDLIRPILPPYVELGSGKIEGAPEIRTV